MLRSCGRSWRPSTARLLIGKRSFSMDPAPLINTLTDTLQNVHSLTGIPWWGLVPITTVVMRGVWTLPLAIMQRNRVRKQNELRPVVAATAPVIRAKLATAAAGASKSASGPMAALSPTAQMKYDEIMVLSARETRKRQKALFARHHVQLYKNAFLPLAQVPLWVAMSLTFRNLSGWSTWDAISNKPLDPALYTEGALWFPDLTVLDPLHVFPLAVGVTALVNVEWTFKTFQLLRPARRRRAFRPTLVDSMGNLSRMSVVFLMVVSWHAPVALTLYWLTSQMFSLVQNIALDMLLPLSYTPNKRLDYSVLPNSASDIVHRN